MTEPLLSWDGPVGRWDSRTPAVPDDALVARILGDLRAVELATRDLTDATIGAIRAEGGPHPVDGLLALLYVTRVALVNPASNQARSLMRAIARYDAERQPTIPDADGDAVPRSARPCNLAAIHNPALCESPGCTGGRRAA